jgi:hypothetical protein
MLTRRAPRVWISEAIDRGAHQPDVSANALAVAVECLTQGNRTNIEPAIDNVESAEIT